MSREIIFTRTVNGITHEYTRQEVIELRRNILKKEEETKNKQKQKRQECLDRKVCVTCKKQDDRTRRGYALCQHHFDYYKAREQERKDLKKEILEMGELFELEDVNMDVEDMDSPKVVTM